MAKGFRDMVAEGNAAITTLSVEEASKLLDSPDHLFLDVRESEENRAGCIKGSVHVARGFLEFRADPSSPMHHPAVSPDKTIVLYCASGGRSALAGKTLSDMGFENVCHIAGGFTAWKNAGGPTE